MKSSIPSILILSSLCLLSDAIPLLPRSLLQKKSPQSYSVVAVDGGNTAATTQTVTSQSIQTAYTTILSTIILTESETPITVVVTATSAITITQLVPTAVVTTVSAGTGGVVTVTASPSPSTPSDAATGSSAGAQPAITSSAYDDGSWHTTYYSKWTVLPSSSSPSLSSSSTPPTSTSTSPSAPTTTLIKAAITIPSTTQDSSTSTTESEQSTSTNWATYYGAARATPKDGSWWGK